MALFMSALVLASLLAPPAQNVRDRRDEIEVIGKATPEIRREAEEYIRSLGIANGEHQAARWIDPICPHSIGLGPAESALVDQQVRSVALAVGAPVAKEKCAPNFLVVFTDDAKGIARTVFRKVQLPSESIRDRKELETGEEPIRWWYSSEALTRDATSAGVVTPSLMVETQGIMGAPGGVGGLPHNDDTKSLTLPNSSIVSTQVKRALTHVTIVIDVNAATGKSLRSVVYYASLVGLAEVRLGTTAPNSILGLFGSEPNIGELTVTDNAFLRELYSMNMDRRAEQHRRVLIGGIIRARTNTKPEG
jgi:hypothetical protein